MNARTYSLAEPAVTDHFVCASSLAEHVQWLSRSLVSAGAVEGTPLDGAALSQRVDVLNPALVFIDFSGDYAAASAVVAAVRVSHPGVPVVALGSLAQPEGALAALRAGVRDFVDFSAPADEALRITRVLLDNVGEQASRHGKITALLGARAGMGVSTLAANLSVLMQRRPGDPAHAAALLDLGLPAGDSALFLNTRCEFHFVEAVRNLRRIDRTFVTTALARHSSGVALTTLPPNLGDLREVATASCAALLNRLRAFFDHQIVDLGGFPNRDFIAQVVNIADEAWLVCDQGVASVVSAVEMLDGLRDAGAVTDRIRLVVNQFDADLGLMPAQIAERLKLSLVATLPSRRVSIGHAANQGKLIAEVAERDPYVRALGLLVERLAGASSPGAAQRAAGGLSALRRIIQSSTKRS
ncbi:fimbrial protein [Burkholderia pyrrocinia]|uniref:fimbrial protein n=1 Tax=Burkholderia pyrrocinia TaxID=60550 RepID=UPI00157570CB|nr:fimbrial protein [Burkholderia pyrrocinia]NTX29330.1 fimbrial protein [Burkholderia pyrrocinia]